MALCLCLAGPAAAEFETVGSGGPTQFQQFTVLPYWGTMRLTYGSDSNLLLVPDAPPFHTGEQAGTYAVLTLSGGVLWPINESLSFGLEATGEIVRTFGTQPAGTPTFVTDPEDYSRHVFEPRVFAEFSLGDLTLTPSLSYRVEGGSSVHAVGSQSTILRLDAGYDLSATTHLTAWVQRSRTAFDVEFPGQPTRNRDGDYTDAGVSIRHYFSDFRRAISFGLAMERGDAEGRDWQFEGTRVFAGIESHLGGRFFGDLTLSLTDRDYDSSFDDIVPGGRDSQRITDLGGRITYAFDSRRSLELSARHTDFEANDPAFEGDRSVVAISYVMRLP